MAIFKVPRITTIQRSSLLLETGEIVYDTDQNIFYGGNNTQLGGFPIGSGIGGAGTYVSKTITLTQQNIDDGFVSLNSFPMIPESVVVYPAGGIPQVNGIDFEVSANILSWNGLGLDGFLEAGDIIIVEYQNTASITIETIILTQQNIDNKQLVLSSTPISPETVSLFPLDGLPQINGVDFIVEMNILKWNGLGLDGFLEVNDVLIIQH